MLIKSNHQKEIKKHPLFEDIPDDIFSHALKHCGLMSLKSNEIAFAREDEANYFYLIRSGQIVTFDETSTGKEKIINIFETGDVFAENVLFSKNHTYEYSAAYSGPT